MNIIKTVRNITLVIAFLNTIYAKEECLMGAIDIAQPKRTAIIEIQSMNEFNKYKKMGKPMIVKCYTSWCGPCKELKEPYEQLAKEHGARVNFLAVDGDRAPDVMSALNVQGYPTINFYDKEGDLLFSRIGGLSKGSLIDLAEQLKNGTMQKQGAGKQVVEKERKKPVAAPEPVKEEPKKQTRAQARKAAAQQKKSAPQEITRRGPGGKRIRYVAVEEDED